MGQPGLKPQILRGDQRTAGVINAMRCCQQQVRRNQRCGAISVSVIQAAHSLPRQSFVLGIQTT